MMIEIPFKKDNIEAACCEILRLNGQKEAYIRPLVFLGEGVMGLNPKGSPIQVAIISWVWGAYLGDEGLRRGIRVKTSSFTRHHVNIMMTKTKTVGNYVNSIMAKLEAVHAGYDEALLLDTAGYVCEASGENIFLVKDDDIIKTPPLTSILPGITRDCVITLAQDLGLTVKDERFSRDELYLADEVFLTGDRGGNHPCPGGGRPDHRSGSPRPRHPADPGGIFRDGQGPGPRYQHWLTYL